jgi:DNA repair exonuclease SbcCD ATPase subunit
MKIVHLLTENVKRLKAVEVNPGGANVVVVGGKNGAGKSSLLDSIMYALAGDKALPEKPVRRGQEKAEITIDLGEYVVKKTIKADGSVELKVKTANGVPQKSPQGILNALCGNLTFDPTEFARMKPKEQVELLKKMVGLDFTAMDNEKAARAQERLEIGRVVDQLKGQLEAMPYDDTAPAEPESAIELQKKIKEAREHNASIDNKKSVYLAAESELKRLNAELERIQQQLQVLTSERDTMVNVIESLQPAPEAALVQQLDSLIVTNNKIAANKAKDEVRAKLQQQSSKYDALTETLSRIDRQKSEALAAAKFPVASLSFDDTGVLVNRVPFIQASAAERLRVSLAMGMALNPQLRIMIVRDGSLCDEDSLRLIHEMAEAHDYQIWLEKVTTDGEDAAVIIEDGSAKS